MLRIFYVKPIEQNDANIRREKLNIIKEEKYEKEERQNSVCVIPLPVSSSQRACKRSIRLLSHTLRFPTNHTRTFPFPAIFLEEYNQPFQRTNFSFK
jgi:hypothetical protein